MIQYDENMSASDIESYWSGGYILFPDMDYGGKLYLATVRAIGNKQLAIVKAPDATERGSPPPPEVAVSRSQFFKLAVLHRPPVNIVEKDGSIYQLRWTPPDRGANRAIHYEALILNTLHASVDRLAEAMKSLVEFQSMVFMKDKLPARLTFSKRKLITPKNPISSIDVLLHYLNSKNEERLSAAEIVDVCASSQGIARAIDDDSWVLSTDTNVVDLYIGRAKAATIRKDNSYYRVIESDKIWEHIANRYVSSWNFTS